MFDLVVVKVILGSFSTFNSKLVSQNVKYFNNHIYYLSVLKQSVEAHGPFLCVV